MIIIILNMFYYITRAKVTCANVIAIILITTKFIL